MGLAVGQIQPVTGVIPFFPTEHLLPWPSAVAQNRDSGQHSPKVNGFSTNGSVFEAGSLRWDKVAEPNHMENELFAVFSDQHGIFALYSRLLIYIVVVFLFSFFLIMYAMRDVAPLNDTFNDMNRCAFSFRILNIL